VDGAAHRQRADAPYRHLLLRGLWDGDDLAHRQERTVPLRYYTRSTRARQGETGCKGRTVPMEKLDRLVADHIEHRLLLPSRLEKILSSVLDRREERSERQATHIAELRKRATEADAKLERLYDAIENDVTDLSDLMLKDRITELKAIRDQARADTKRAEGAIERQGLTITTQSIKAFARTARKRMRFEGAGYRRDYLRALARSRRARSSYHGLEKRTAAHARRRFKRKNGGFWRAQFRTEVARHGRRRWAILFRRGAMMPQASTR
jgi:hypothetical protein